MDKERNGYIDWQISRQKRTDYGPRDKLENHCLLVRFSLGNLYFLPLCQTVRSFINGYKRWNQFSENLTFLWETRGYLERCRMGFGYWVIDHFEQLIRFWLPFLMVPDHQKVSALIVLLNFTQFFTLLERALERYFFSWNSLSKRKGSLAFLCISTEYSKWNAVQNLNHTSTPSQYTFVIYEALCFDVAQGRMNGAPNETRTHLCRFASLAC